ncbi:prolipoprotein diacylglyceryl transferase [Alkalibacterium olivapovliticus]|uniref:Phosphatidylglycerol--prolipoprotein diacylglyceryl transferase n=1 Tax=Alkalibacterium olivapovliticus TaxID=99907 RepID=A0A2T0VXC7_9LACT|nr:prolipoprotein diacylglyceryl transferase [Alkalibacterium olivapovliticus]PRY76799.1 phosphatidylglycerol:prolipoprotein diacylglycerol transferase [Alkalibacterium olivapovliticus]
MNVHLMTINPIAFEIGPLSVAWYGLIIVVGMILAIYLSIKEAKKRGISEDFVVDTAFWVVPLGILGARLYYVLFELDYYLANPLKIFAIWEGGLAIYGGIIAGVLTIYWRAKKDNIPMLLFIDILAPYTLLGQSIGRWGNFINQEAHGGEVSRQFLVNLMLPEFIIEGMHINGAYYHPTFLYESLWSLLGVALLLVLRNQKQLLLRGETTASYLIWYGFGRLLIEGLRTDSLYLGSFRISQGVSAVIILIGIGIILYQRRYAYPKPEYYTDGMQYELEFERKKEAYKLATQRK